MIFNNQKGKVLQNLLLLHNILFKKIFCTLNFDILELDTFGFLFASYLSRIFPNGEFTSSSNLLQVHHDLHLHAFSNLLCHFS